MYVIPRLGGRVLAALLAVVMVLSWLAIAALAKPGTALADTAPPVSTPPTPTTVSADALPTVQIDGVVWSQAIVGNTVYAGGSFANARPAGAAAGTNLTTRNNFLSYDITTGVLNTSFVPNLNGQVLAVAASPDGSRVYVGGDFTTANGSSHLRVAAYNTATGQPVATFAPNLNARVRAIVATNTTVYVGGSFSTANGVARSKLAAFSASNGALLSWAPPADAGVNAMVMAPDQSKIIVGGQFTTLNGASWYGMGALDPVSGASLPWAADATVQDGGINAAIDTLSTDGTNIYGAGYVFGAGGNLEGTFAANPANGNIIWLEDCHGDTYSTYSTGSVLYLTGHPHFCDDVPGGFPQTNPWTFHRTLAFGTAVTGTLLHNPESAYADFGGSPAPTQLDWYPTITSGTYTGQNQGPWDVTGNGQYVVEGGEFPTVNGTAQQGLVRFAVSAIAPNKQGPVVTGANFVPSLVSLTSGTVRVGFQANWDQDNTALLYKVVRDGNTAAPVYQTTVNSTFFNRPELGFTDTGLVVGQTYKYRLYVTDPFGNTVVGDTVSVTVGSTTLSPYAKAVLNDAPVTYWRLGESAGLTAYDWAGYTDGIVGSGVTRGAPGAIIGDTNTASTFNGTATSSVISPASQPGPNSFSIEAWVKTTTTTGGKIIGFGDSNTGDSGSYDRHLYMDDAGQIIFGVYPGQTVTITSGASYNDGQWHHVVATMGSGGMALYIDAKRVGQNPTVTTAQAYNGYWKVGGDNIGGWPNQPTSEDFTGSIDDVAIYSAPLTAAQVTSHYIASGRTAPVGTRPTDVYGSTVFDATPDAYWRLDETSGTVAKDITPNGANGTYSGGVTLGVPGAISGTTDTAITLNGVDGLVSSALSSTAPSVYTEEVWFKTTTTSGGKIIGFGSSPTGPCGSYDRHVYMINDGQLIFGTWTGQENLVTSPASYNDGQWHLLVATQGSDGMKLYVDGGVVGTNPQTAAQDYDGYWRVGGDTTWGGASSDYFAGSVDDVAVYSSELSAAQVADHFAKGKGAANVLPTAAFSSMSTNLIATFNGGGSTDTDGTIVSYAWTFGDGTTGTGVTPTHTYATANTYTVGLTVTDNLGGTNTVSHPVTVTAPNVLPTAAFSSMSTNLTATFNGGGSTDTDGTIVSYTWTFGDGTTGTGVAPTHTYATANTYTVGLTVTDNSGGTNTVSHPITVSTAVTPGQYAADAFGRSVANGFGTADLGGPWSLTGKSTAFSVASGAGFITAVAAGVSDAAYLANVSSTDTQVQVGVSLNQVQNGGGTYVSVIGRRVNANTDYEVKLRFLAGGAVTESLVAVVAGTTTTLKTVTVAGLTYAPGAVLEVKLQVTGMSPTTLNSRVWLQGAAEPSTWQVSTTDSTAGLQLAGAVALLVYLSASSTTVPETASFTAFSAGATH
jgi:PKD repeat protein